MWKVRRISKDNEVYLGNVYCTPEGEIIYIGNCRIYWYIDNTEAVEGILEAFREPIVEYFDSKPVF